STVQPGRRVDTRPAYRQYLAVPLWRDEREQELSRRARNAARPLGRGKALLSFVGVLTFEPLEHPADAIVQHQRTICIRASISRWTSARTKQRAMWSLTTPHACIEA